MGGGPDGGMQLTVTGPGWEAAEQLEGAAEAAVDPQDEVPASDRVVRLDHNSAEYVETVGKLEGAITTIQGSNAYAAEDPDDHGQRLAELESGKRLLLAARVRVESIRVVLVPALRWLAEKFADNAAGMIITAALTAILAFFGIPL